MANKFTAPLSHHTANSMSLMLVVGGALLVVLAGAFMVIGALLGSLIENASEEIESSALLAPAHVLLFLILVVLLIVLWHHLRGAQAAPATAAPSPQFAAALNATAKALRGNAEALGLIQGDGAPANAAAIGAVQADLRRAAEALEKVAET
jgi:hypothetical protein